MARKDPTNPNPPFAHAYPIVFFGGVLLLCAWILIGNRIFTPSEWFGHAVARHESVGEH